MNCPDCGKPADDLHTCIEYERNRADDLEKQLIILHHEVQRLKLRISQLEGQRNEADKQTQLT